MFYWHIAYSILFGTEMVKAILLFEWFLRFGLLLSGGCKSLNIFKPPVVIGILLRVVPAGFWLEVCNGAGLVFGFGVWWFMEIPLLILFSRVFSRVVSFSTRRCLGFRPLFFQGTPFFMPFCSCLFCESLFLLLDTLPVARNQF